MPTNLPVAGALLLLVLPPVAVLCVLLTGPVAAAIGRWQKEEAQVARAPVIVAGIALLLEVAVALMLRDSPAVADQLRVTSRVGVLWVDCYAVSTVIALSVATFLALFAAEAARPPEMKLSTAEVVSVLFLWGAHAVLALAGTLELVAAGVAVANLGVGIILLHAARLEAKPARAGATLVALLVPMAGWLLLSPLRALPAAPDLYEASSALRMADPAAVRGALAGLWLAGLAPLAVALGCFAGLLEARRAIYAGPAALLAVGLTAALPILFRVTVAAFPNGASLYAWDWLGPRLAGVAVVVGVAALALAQLRIGLTPRLVLVGLSQLCLGAWALSRFDGHAARAGLWGFAFAGLAVPFCLGYAASARWEDRRADRLQATALLGAPAMLLSAAFIGWVLGVAVDAPLAHRLAGIVLVGLACLSACRLVAELRRIVGEARGGRFTGVLTWREGALFLLVIALVFWIAFPWTRALVDLSPPLR